MRLALVSQAYPPLAGGGISTQTFAKAHGLAALGHSVHVIAHSPDHLPQELWDGPVHVLRIPNLDARLPIATEAVRWLTYSVEVAAALAALHTQVHLDLVDFPEYGGEGTIHLLNRTTWQSLPTVIQLHGPLGMLADTIGWPDRESDFYRVGVHIEQTSLRMADAVYSSSHTSAAWCAGHYGLDIAQIPIIHTGVDIDLFQPEASAQPSRPTVIFVGKVVENKGVTDLLEAVCHIAPDFPGLHLGMVGPGDSNLIERLLARAAASGHPDLLEIVGFLPHHDLPAQLTRSHIFAAPSRYEGGPGFVYLEAMACGLPVIACSGSGASEVVLPGETGLLVAPGDVDALARALRRLLADPEYRAQMGQRARRFVLDEADSRRCLRRLEAFYAGVIANKAGP